MVRFAGEQLFEQANTNVNVSVFGSILYNVKAFGAKGDGIKDDTVAIQATINYAVLHGGIVFFPPGIYKVTTTINITSHKITIMGDNAQTFIVFSPSDLTKDCFSANGIGFIPTANSIKITGLNFVTDKTLTGGAMIHLKRTSQCIIENCQFLKGFTAVLLEEAIQTSVRYNFIENYTNGVISTSSDSMNQSIDTFIEDNYIRDCANVGIYFAEYCNGIFIRRNTCFTNGTNVSLFASQAGRIFSVMIQQNDLDSGTNKGLDMVRVENFQLNDNWVSSNAVYSMHLDVCNSGTISGNNIYPLVTAGQTNFGLYLEGCSILTVTGNNISGGDGAIRIDRTNLVASTACKAINFSSNNISFMPLGIHLYNSSPVSNGVSIIGNIALTVSLFLGNGATTNLINVNNNLI